MNLKQLYGSKYRVTTDPSYDAEKEDGKTQWQWRYHEIIGKYGTLYPFSENQLAVRFDSIHIANRFSGRGWKVIQDGTDERTALVPKEAATEVLTAIRARKKRQLTPEQKLVMVERAAKARLSLPRNLKKP
jgi:hypothetical protein